MIFITVGTAHYDPLIERVDQLVSQKKITETVIAQIGRGSYVPKHFRYFRFIRSLNSAYEKADVIISTGGAGTTIECVKRGVKLVVVENTTLMEGHQAQLIGELSERGHLVWCRNLDHLEKCIAEVTEKEFTPFVTDKPLVHRMIREMVNET
ncbi:MAG: PssE/Cps14G family polysaccharide biosynthesis glycosyltransferase [Candidatus Thorarchaeota archaeon]